MPNAIGRSMVKRFCAKRLPMGSEIPTWSPTWAVTHCITRGRVNKVTTELMAVSDTFGGDLITIADEEGNEFELEMLGVMDLDGESYAVFVPADIENMDVNDPDYGLIFLRIREENGEEFFDSVDDDEELQRVYEAYQMIMDAEDEE